MLKNKRNSDTIFKSQLSRWVSSINGYLCTSKISGILEIWFSMFWLGEKRKIENFIFCKEHQIPSLILQHFQQSQQLGLLVYLLLVFEKKILVVQGFMKIPTKEDPLFTDLHPQAAWSGTKWTRISVKLEWHGITFWKPPNHFKMLNLA